MFNITKIFLIVCSVISMSQFGNASTVNMPVKEIDFTNHVIKIEKPNWFSSGIYELFFENDSFNVISLSIIPPSGGEGRSVQTVSEGKIINWDLENGVVADQNTTSYNPVLFDSKTISNCEAIDVDGRSLVLEDSYVPRHDIEGTYYITYEKCLKFAVVSNEENLVGGIIAEVTDDNEIGFISDYRIITFWSLEDGEKQYQRYLEEELIICDIYIIDLSFKHSGRYLKVKHLGKAVYVPNGGVLIYVPTSVKLIDTHTFEQLPADRVAAFSPGDTYMFTEWEGEPAIVHVDSLRVAQKVSVPEPMTAAVFSPDGSKLYVATVENMIYVYDTPLTSTAGTWECYE